MRALAPIAVWLGLAVGFVVFARSRPAGCPDLSHRVFLAGGADEVDAALEACTADLASGTRRDVLLVGAAFALLMAVLAPVLHRLWGSAWRARPFREWTFVGGIAAGSAVLSAAATAVVALGSEGDGAALAVDQWAAATSAALAWPAAILGVFAVVAAGFSVLATIGSTKVPVRPADGARWEPPGVGGLGVCVSGGGIRAGGVALGALAYLERHRLDGTPVEPTSGESVLDSATYLASVSGGGYTAGAWRIARGPAPVDGAVPATWPDGVFGDVLDQHDPPASAFDDAVTQPDAHSSLFRHMWARRDFLRTGRGGMGLSILLFATTVALQLVLLAAGVAVVAWPLGALTRSWPILGPEYVDAQPFSFSVGARSVVPVLAILVVALMIVVVRSTMLRTTARLALDGIVAMLVLAAAGLAGLLIGLPALVAAIADLGAATAAVASIFAVGGIAVTVGQAVLRVLGPRLARLGGLLLAAAALVVGSLVVRAAAIPGGALRDDVDLGWITMSAPVAYVASLVAFLLVWSFADPRWWSLFPVYRNRIRSAFAVTRDAAAAASAKPVSPGLYPLARRHEPTLDEYRGAPGPQHLVCCAVARGHGQGTGIPALSFVFSADDVRMYEPGPDGLLVHGVPTDRFVRALERRVFTKLPARRPKSLGTTSAAIAMSGAAVTSSMGRHDVGTTNSLIAGLNIRLGAWVPNPRHVAVDGRPAKRARVNYLVKELFGWYDLDDPHVYVTDGGHWDNLGLVELLRRRCETIVCIDASGDTPGTFATLLDAFDLALVECAARVDVDDGPHPLAHLRTVDHQRLPVTCSAVGRITYLDDAGEPAGTGVLLVVKAHMSAELSTPLIGFSFEDRLFPSYSTADQFLGADQFRMLARLGWEATQQGLAKLAASPATVHAARHDTADRPVGDGDGDGDGADPVAVDVPPTSVGDGA